MTAWSEETWFKYDPEYKYKKKESCPDELLVFQEQGRYRYETYVYMVDDKPYSLNDSTNRKEAYKDFAKQLFEMRYEMDIPEYSYEDSDFTDEDLLQYFDDKMGGWPIDEICEYTCPYTEWPEEYDLVTIEVNYEQIAETFLEDKDAAAIERLKSGQFKSYELAEFHEIRYLISKLPTALDEDFIYPSDDFLKEVIVKVANEK